MLYRIAHILRDRLPWIWDVMGLVLSWLFGLRYSRQLRLLPDLLADFSKRWGDGYVVDMLQDSNVEALATMFAQQPEDSFVHFRPHGFEVKDLRKLVKDNGFLAFVVRQHETTVGYFFQRSFFWGKSYRGYLTDCQHRRRGINKMMNGCANEISRLFGFRVFGTIAPDNVASMLSAQSAGEVKVLETLPNGDRYVEYVIS